MWAAAQGARRSLSAAPPPPAQARRARTPCEQLAPVVRHRNARHAPRLRDNAHCQVGGAHLRRFGRREGCLLCTAILFEAASPACAVKARVLASAAGACWGVRRRRPRRAAHQRPRDEADDALRSRIRQPAAACGGGGQGLQVAARVAMGWAARGSQGKHAAAAARRARALSRAHGTPAHPTRPSGRGAAARAARRASAPGTSRGACGCLGCKHGSCSPRLWVGG